MFDDKLHLSWDDVYRQSLELAAKIKAAGERFDYLVVVPRGGYFVANAVARELDYGPTELLHACVGSYEAGENNQLEQLIVGEMPDTAKIKGKRLLVVDEVCDTGETLAFVTDYLEQAGAAEVQGAVLHYKPSHSRTGYVPGWFVEETGQWIVYPWEEREFSARL